MARTSLVYGDIKGWPWRPEDDELARRVRARKDCPACGLPQVVEEGKCVDCGKEN